MGLPLFIAPVESDTKSESPNKRRAPEQTIYRPRRAGRVHRSRQTTTRAGVWPGSERADDLLNAATADWAPSGRFGSSGPNARYPWIESGQLPPPEAYSSNWDSDNVPPRRVSRLAPDFRPLPSTTTRLGHRTAMSTSREPTHDDLFGDDENGPAGRLDLSSIDSNVAARFDRSPVRTLSNREREDANERRRRMQRSAQLAYMIRRARAHENSARANNNAIDGLGDRSRSLSPEPWDTLQTTLTPDPQPPSAGSSFTSAIIASQSAGASAAASSRTSLSGLEATDDRGVPVEPPCDPVDDDEPTDDGMSEDALLETRRARANDSSRSFHRRYTTLDSNNYNSTSNVRGTGDRPTLQYPGRPEHRRPRDSQRLLVRIPMSTRLDAHGQRRGGGARATLDRMSRNQTSQEPSRESNHWGWDEPESGAGSDNDRNATAEGAEPRDMSTLMNSMQHIVRDLVQNDDIPDAFWTDLGLNRTSGDGS